MVWYKAFDKDLKCRGMQYKVGEEYKLDGKPTICYQGFHYCKSMVDCYMFYPMTDDTRICEVEPLGEVIVDKDGIKFCTNHIKIVREIENPREMSNVGKSSSGFFNSGSHNSGSFNSGYCNSGIHNSGSFNSGDCNSGDYNRGRYNSGNHNNGVLNSGSYNSGSCNSGHYNKGRCNSGDFNSGHYNSGIFNTETNPKIRIFDKESHWTLADWHLSKAAKVMCSYPNTTIRFIRESDMSDEEKSNHSEYTTIGGYLKTIIATKEDKQKWWDNLPDEDKQAVYDLPNFDADKFEKCTGIKVNFDFKPEDGWVIEKITEIKFL